MDLLKIEFLKIKRFNLFLLSVITSLPAIAIAIGLYNVVRDKIDSTAIMEVIFGLSSSVYIGMILNLLIIYLVCTITKIENADNGWRELLTLPIKKWKIYISKIFTIFILIVISLLAFLIFTMLVTVFLGGSINLSILVNLILVFLTTMPIVLLLFVVARNFTLVIAPLVLGLFFLITGFFIVQSDYWIFAPWTYSLVVSSGTLNNWQLIFVIILSIILSLLSFGIDLIKFTSEDLAV